MSAALSLPRCSGGFLGPAVTQTLEQQALSVVSQLPWAASLTHSKRQHLPNVWYIQTAVFE